MVNGVKAFKSDFEARESKWTDIMIPNIDFHFGSSKEFYPETIRTTVDGNPAKRHSAAQLLSSFERFHEIIFQGRPKKATGPRSLQPKMPRKQQTVPNIEVRSERSEPTSHAPNYEIAPKKATGPRSLQPKMPRKQQTVPNIEVRSEGSEPTSPAPNYEIASISMPMPMPMPITSSSTFQITRQMPEMPMMFPSPIPWSSASVSQKPRPLAAPSELPSVPQLYPPAS
jgi:hypothetical protein